MPLQSATEAYIAYVAHPMDPRDPAHEPHVRALKLASDAERMEDGSYWLDEADELERWAAERDALALQYPEWPKYARLAAIYRRDAAAARAKAAAQTMQVAA